MFLDYFALGLLIFMAVMIFYAIIAIHDIPYEISKKRNHPHQDAIHYAGWVSLFTLHILWPFLWIWATLWRDDRGWGFNQIQQEQNELHHEVFTLSKQVEKLVEKVDALSAENQALKQAAEPMKEQTTETSIETTEKEVQD